MRSIWLALLLAIAPIERALPWGSEGHSIVAEIAQRRLSPAASQKVREILKGNVSLASISSWADDVRAQRVKTTKEHFVDIPLSASNYDPARDCTDTPKGDCIINAIERNKQTLADPNAAALQRQEALMFLVHFIGDIHQPLHTVDDFVGGNTFPVSFFVDPGKHRVEATNLHVVWDTGVIQATSWAWGSYLTRAEAWLAGKDITALSAGSPEEWALAAHKDAVDVAFTIQQNEQLSEDYLKRAQQVVDRQLALAGVRLARVLNEILQ